MKDIPDAHTNGCDIAHVNGKTSSHRVGQSTLQLLFREQQRLLNCFFDKLEYEQVEEFCQACLACQGYILFTGVGKSGFVAHKISQTLVSTGTRAAFLNPTDALHGDIGIVSPDDLLVCFSKSGNTDELLKLVPFAKAKGAKIVSVTSVRGNKLEQWCHLAVHLPLERELCPFDLAPVTSTAIQMLFGDTVAIAMMQAKRLTKDEYAMNHPAGRIGKRLTLRVADLMLQEPAVPKVLPDTKVVNCLVEMSSKGCGCVLVVGPAQQLLGTFTDGDMRRALQRMGGVCMEEAVSSFMFAKPVVCTSDMMAMDAMEAMEFPRKLMFLPVVDGDKLVGLVTLHGLVSAGL